jgi:hypothetical protein
MQLRKVILMARRKTYLNTPLGYWHHLNCMRFEFDEMLTYKNIKPETAELIKQAKEIMIKATEAQKGA